ncbi:uncharacterized protein LOC124954880 [Vespa velutina]|uniref:uncharacterized protein LOC124954880 n=1 Tax=Vespa velutina TaxID=202808 RepID=UPI001FB49B5E|nr:uncharacterized protein LOC124954880 [Vespa velutina]
MTSVLITKVGTVNNSNSILKELRLYIYDNTTEQKFLIDSGSIVSVLLVKKFRKNRKISPGLSSSQLKLITETTIIGVDLLTHYNLLIDLKHQQLIDPVIHLLLKGKVMEQQHYDISTISSDLSTQYAELLKQFIEITRLISKSCLNSKARPFAYKITTHAHLLVTARARKLTGGKAAAIKIQIRELLNSGIIRPSTCMYASSIHMIQKKDNNWRMCGDYRKLNDATYP